MQMEKSKLMMEERVWVVRSFCRWDADTLAWFTDSALLPLHMHRGVAVFSLILPCKERLG